MNANPMLHAPNTPRLPIGWGHIRRSEPHQRRRYYALKMLKL